MASVCVTAGLTVTRDAWDPTTALLLLGAKLVPENIGYCGGRAMTDDPAGRPAVNLRIHAQLQYESTS